MGYALKEDKKYTWQDYLNWPDSERWEIINGEAYNMTPAPVIKHQDIAGNFFSILKQKLSGRQCRPFIAPTDVVLSEHDVVQPDLLVVCDKKKITAANIQGAPDMVIEVLSPSTALKDKREKRDLYERFGVKEYLIVDPTEMYVERFLLGSDGGYGKGDVFGPKEVISLKSLDGLEINLWEVFEIEGPEEKIEAEK